MVAIIRVRNPERELTLHLYRAEGEQNFVDDIRGSLLTLGLEPRVLRRNPVTDDVWKLVLDLVQNHGQHAATGAAIVGMVTLWLKQRKGRQVEIDRPGLKVKAANSRELGKALAALHNYDELNITLNVGHSPKPTTKKKVITRRPRKSK